MKKLSGLKDGYLAASDVPKGRIVGSQSDSDLMIDLIPCRKQSPMFPCPWHSPLLG